MSTQQQIIRQSSLTRALEFFKLNEMTPSLTDVVLTADVLTEWVETGKISRVRDFDKHYLIDSMLEKIK